MLDSNKDIAIHRQIESLKTLSADVEKSRLEVELLKITDGEEEAEIAKWNAEAEAKLSKTDDSIKQLEKWQDHCKLVKEENAFEEQLKYEVKLHETKLKLESERQAKLKTEMSAEETKAKKVEAKLPKLVISKFERNYMDWQRFWGQFTESIEKSGLVSIEKFSYLRELLGDNVRHEVESLPFTPEGYNRKILKEKYGRKILKEKYGRESEIVKAYVNEILGLPYVSSADVKKIAEFGDKLTFCVQSLQSLNKLDEVKGLTMMTQVTSDKG